MANPEIESSNYPLPVVSEETAKTQVEDVWEIGPERYMVDATNNFVDNNPNANRSLLSFAELACKTEGEKMMVHSGAVILHQMLIKQADAEKLDEQFNG